MNSGKPWWPTGNGGGEIENRRGAICPRCGQYQRAAAPEGAVPELRGGVSPGAQAQEIEARLVPGLCDTTLLTSLPAGPLPASATQAALYRAARAGCRWR